MSELNALRWSGAPGHYEVYYLTLTDPRTGVGAWIRYTMLAPLAGGRSAASCALWFAVMDPGQDVVHARRVSFPIEALTASAHPFELRIGSAQLSDRGMSGTFEDVAWDLTWTPAAQGMEHVHPLLQRARIAKTVLALPHPDVAVGGSLRWGERELELQDARGGQAHLWGSKHAGRWCWVHCGDFRGLDGEPRPGTFIDGVSVIVPRMGRDVGPSTPVVGRLLDEDFASTSPLRVVSNPSRLALTGWHFEARTRRRRVRADVDAPRSTLVGVTYHDPDGDLAYCYNSEVCSMQLRVWDRVAGSAASWRLRDTLVCDGRAHFEYAQREPVPGLELHVT